MRGLCSANRPKRWPPCEVAQGFWLIEVFSRGVCAGGGAEQNDENGEGAETNNPHVLLPSGLEPTHVRWSRVHEKKKASVQRVRCVRRDVLSSHTVASTTFANVCTRNVVNYECAGFLQKMMTATNLSKMKMMTATSWLSDSNFASQDQIAMFHQMVGVVKIHPSLLTLESSKCASSLWKILSICHSS